MVYDVSMEQCQKFLFVAFLHHQAFQSLGTISALQFFLLHAIPSNCCVLIWFHLHVSCFDVLSNTCSVAENTFIVMLAIGNFNESTSCRGQRRLLWICCHFFWNVSSRLCAAPNARHGVSFPKVQDWCKAGAKTRCKSVFYIISQGHTCKWDKCYDPAAIRNSHAHPQISQYAV